jgi:hypothetical protein
MSERFENQVVAKDQVELSGEKATHLASTYYECWRGGPIVKDRKECHGMEKPWSFLPEFTLSEQTKT